MRIDKDVLHLLRSNKPRVFTFQQIFCKLGMEHPSMDELDKALELLLKAKRIGTMTGLDEGRVYQFNDGSFAAGGFLR
jgi:hypothetical protein